jgi:hypothetical protein
MPINTILPNQRNSGAIGSEDFFWANLFVNHGNFTKFSSGNVISLQPRSNRSDLTYPTNSLSNDQGQLNWGTRPFIFGSIEGTTNWLNSNAPFSYSAISGFPLFDTSPLNSDDRKYMNVFNGALRWANLVQWKDVGAPPITTSSRQKILKVSDNGLELYWSKQFNINKLNNSTSLSLDNDLAYTNSSTVSKTTIRSFLDFYYVSKAQQSSVLNNKLYNSSGDLTENPLASFTGVGSYINGAWVLSSPTILTSENLSLLFSENTPFAVRDECKDGGGSEINCARPSVAFKTKKIIRRPRSREVFKTNHTLIERETIDNNIAFSKLFNLDNIVPSYAQFLFFEVYGKNCDFDYTQPSYLGKASSNLLTDGHINNTITFSEQSSVSSDLLIDSLTSPRITVSNSNTSSTTILQWYNPHNSYYNKTGVYANQINVNFKPNILINNSASYEAAPGGGWYLDGTPNAVELCKQSIHNSNLSQRDKTIAAAKMIITSICPLDPPTEGSFSIGLKLVGYFA